MMGFGEEGEKFPQKFFPSSPITKQPLLGTDPYYHFFNKKFPVISRVIRTFFPDGNSVTSP